MAGLTAAPSHATQEISGAGCASTLTGGGTTAPAGDLTGSKNIQGSNGSGTFSVAGGQANGVSYLLDGGDNNDSFSNVNLPIPFPDAVREFSVQTNALQAQFGLHPGGVVGGERGGHEGMITCPRLAGY